MKNCAMCGTRVNDQTRYCPNCGSTKFQVICSSCGTAFTGGHFCPNCGTRADSGVWTICPSCGTEYQTPACPNCGYMESASQYEQYHYTRPNDIPYTPPYSYQTIPVPVPVPSGKRCDKAVSLLLCFFLGYLGAHKFYEGRTVMGILYLLTVGLFGIGWIFDFFIILFKPNPYYIQ